MLRNNIRFLSTALKSNLIPIPNDIEGQVNRYLLKHQKNKSFIDQYYGSICKECFGSGWKTDTRCKLNYVCNFKFNICKKCNGRGYI
tara:strand:+ start:10247 stop:10507 length:261 start_codon:yes stop_codon:yes gene_type:complete